MGLLDGFFNLGNKATGGDPLRKSQYDYYLYFIVFLTFLALGVNYFYQFFFNGGALSTLMWGVIVFIFCWFNYFALGAFRGVYENMKKFRQAQGLLPKQETKQEDVKEMLDGFKHVK